MSRRTADLLVVFDAAFQRRSVERIEVLRNAGTAVLFVSHDMGLVRRVCEHAVWLNGGSVRAAGDAAAVVEGFLQAAVGQGQPLAGIGVLGQVGLKDRWGAPAPALRTGDPLRVSAIVDDPTGEARWLSVLVERPADGLRVVDTSTALAGGREQLEVTFERLDLAPGRHQVVVAVYDRSWGTCLGEHRATLDVRGEGPDRAPLAPPHEWHQGVVPDA